MTSTFDSKYKTKRVFLNDMTSIKAIMIFNCTIILAVLIGILYLLISNTDISEFILKNKIQKEGYILIALLSFLLAFLSLTIFYGLFLKSRRRFMRHFALVATTPTPSTDKKMIAKKDIKKRMEEYKHLTIKKRRIFLTIYFCATTVAVTTILVLIFVLF